MKIAVWNVRELNSPSRHTDVTSLVHEHNLSLIGLVETKVRDGNHIPIRKELLPRGLWSIIILTILVAEFGYSGTRR